MTLKFSVLTLNPEIAELSVFIPMTNVTPKLRPGQKVTMEVDPQRGHLVRRSHGGGGQRGGSRPRGQPGRFHVAAPSGFQASVVNS